MIQFYDVTESALSKAGFSEERLYFCTDTGNIYLDSMLDGRRVAIARDIIILGTENERTSMLSPVPDRLYCVIGSGSIYIHHGGVWVKLGSREQIHLNNLVVTGGNITVSDNRILAGDTAIFVPDASVADLVSSSSATCSDGSVTVSVESDYEIFGEVIIN